MLDLSASSFERTWLAANVFAGLAGPTDSMGQLAADQTYKTDGKIGRLASHIPIGISDFTKATSRPGSEFAKASSNKSAHSFDESLDFRPKCAPTSE